MSPIFLLGLVTLGCFFSILPTHGQSLTQQYQFERLGEKQGLTSTNISMVYQDRKGFLWIATINGIYRYDGFHYKLYRNDPFAKDGLSSDYVKKIVEDTRGGLWAITEDNHLHIYDYESDSFKKRLFFVEEDNRKPLKISQIAADKNGTLWVIAITRGLYVLPTEGNILKRPANLPDQIKMAHLVSTDTQKGLVWLVIQSKLFSFRIGSQAGTTADWMEHEDLHVDRVNCLLPDTAGGVWIAGYMDHILYASSISGKSQSYPYPYNQADSDFTALNRINTLTEDGEGKIWAGTNYAGIIILDPDSGQITALKHERANPFSLASNTITSIIRDKSGIIWIATWGSGLHKYVSQRAHFYHYPSIATSPGTLSDANTLSFCEDHNGFIWIGTSDGLNKLDRQTGKIQRYFLPEKLTASRSIEIHSIQSGTARDPLLWVGTTLGLMRFNPATGEFTKWRSKNKSAESLEKNIIYYLPKDLYGKLWAVSYWPYRLFLYDPVQDNFNQIEALGKLVHEGEPIYLADGQNNIWIGTMENVFYKYDLTQQKLFPFRLHPADSSGFNTHHIGHFYSADDNHLWVGTQSGLYSMKLDNKGQPLPARRFTEKDGLPGTQINGILAFNDTLWLSTNNGLCSFDPKHLTFRNYTATDGLQANEFGFGVCYKSPSTKELLFGGPNGFNIFLPGQIAYDSVVPSVTITGMEVIRGNDKYFLPYNLTDNFTSQEPIIFTSRDKVITFNFAALHFADPHRNQFAYKMEGFDKNWRQAGNYPQATYTNLDPGKYTFKVRASNKDGIWNEEGTLLPIQVLPPWWNTWWAWILYLVFLSAMLLGAFKYERNRQEERSEARRISELDNLKTRLYTNITHEFRTPLTIITGMADTIETPPQARELIQRNAQSLLNLVNQILDLSKLEWGQLKLDLKQDDIIPFLENVIQSFQPYASNKNIDLYFYPEISELLIDLDDTKMISILSNLISNAIKFTPEGGRILVHLKKDGETITLKVKDTGIGIQAEKLPYIFDRFYQVNDSAMLSGLGTGIGLTLTKELVELMGGVIEVKSELQKGTEFILRLPMTNKAALGTFNSGVFARSKKPVLSMDQETSGEVSNPAQDDLQLVLLIEDNEDMATYIRSCLPDAYRVMVSTDGEKGIQQAFTLIPDIIISDVMMPEKDGLEVCHILKQDERTSHIPIILLTALADPASRLQGLQKGADAYLTKPFSREELIIRLEKLLELRKTLQYHYATRFEQDSVLDMVASEPSLEDLFLEKVNQILEIHYSEEEFGNAQLASRLHISESQLFRKLKALTGKSTAVYIRSFRLQKGKELLSTTSFTVAEIAYRVGFSDPAYFSRTFSMEFGAPPNTTRNS